jgi:TonB family protein
VKRSRKRTLIGYAIVSLLGLLLAGTLVAGAVETPNQGTSRKVRLSVPPEYPEIARRLNIKGIARVEAIVAADGKVVSVKELGGNPVLVDALVRAVKKWKYEATAKESLEEVKFEFGQ